MTSAADAADLEVKVLSWKHDRTTQRRPLEGRRNCVDITLARSRFNPRCNFDLRTIGGASGKSYSLEMQRE